MNLKVKVIILVAAICILLAGPLSYFSLYVIHNQSIDAINEQLESTVQQAVAEVDGWAQIKAKVIETLGTVIESTVPLKQIGMEHLQAFQLPENKQDIATIYFGLEDGTYLDGAGFIPDASFDARERPWYLAIKEADKLYFSDAYITKAGVQSIYIGVPLHDQNGGFQGAISENISLDSIKQRISSIETADGFTFLVDRKGVVLSHPDQELLNKPLAEQADYADLMVQLLGQPSGHAEYTYNNDDQLLYFEQIPGTGWVIATSVSQKAAFAGLASTQKLFVTFIVLFTLALAVGAYLFALKALKPLLSMRQSAEKLAAGDLTVHVQVKGKDEIARLGDSFNAMAGSLRKLITGVNQSAEVVQGASKIMYRDALGSNEIAGQISAVIDDIAKGASEQAESIQAGAEMVAGINEVIDQITDIARNTSANIMDANQAMSSGIGAVSRQGELAQAGQQNADRVEAANQLLLDKINEISQITGSIQSIASQTNLLALNASIEAARAGENGRGFAVVAGEVRKLAEQSSHSVTGIDQLLKELHEAGQQSAAELEQLQMNSTAQQSSMEETSGAFNRIRQSVDDIIAKIEYVTNGMTEIKAGSVQVSDVITGLAAVAEQSAASTEEAASSTMEQSATIGGISDAAKQLAESAAQLLQEINMFKTQA
ncbi:methyl-accepting chemotaxis protein [Paenibacillus sp. MMS20-IR301]|uniref:methyl-accepting chemotaxis protein n=1 Tax=Paenibacillus sp. MMS20-IR301 TaxID=2895946 RepID=UPI0028EA3B23|nr:methyl-accepting chemotaxis protein [Paenibacillus sp. MMS20-IR301]WNS45572.1 methyl-accepting chemotaxis protein [Paenibacillus sp. MMS20-IR301]